MEYFYIYSVFIGVAILLYMLHRGKVENYSYLKPYRKIRYKELVAIRYVEHRSQFSMDTMFSWMYYQVKKKKVYRFDDISNTYLTKEVNPNIKGSSYFLFKFTHNNEIHELRISPLFYYYLLSIKISPSTAVEFTKEAMSEWHVLSLELEKEQKIDYIELYKLMHLRKNEIDSSVIATDVHRASSQERKEFEFYPLECVIIWTALLIVFLDLLGRLTTSNFIDYFVFPLLVISLWYGFYFYKKRAWYWKNSKVYKVKGELSFDYNLFTYVLNGRKVHLSRSWKSFFDKHIQKDKAYFVEMNVLLNRVEEYPLISTLQPISLKVLNTRVDYKKLSTQRHPLYLIILVCSIWYLLFGFNYEKPLVKSFYGLKSLYEKDKDVYFPYKEVDLQSFPIPMLDNNYNVKAYALVDERKSIENVYRGLEKIEKSFEFDEIYLKLNNDYSRGLELSYDRTNLGILVKYSFEKLELHSKLIKLLKKKYEIVEKLNQAQGNAFFAQGIDKDELKKSLLKIDVDLSSSYIRIQKNEINQIKKHLESFVDSLNSLYSVSHSYIKYEGDSSSVRGCNGEKSCFKELQQLYDVYNKVIVLPQIRNIKGVVSPYAYDNYELNLIEKKNNYTQGMINTFIASTVWIILFFIFVLLGIVALHRSTLYIFGFLSYLIHLNKEDIELKESLVKVGIPSESVEREKQFRLTAKMVVIMVVSFIVIIVLLALSKSNKDSPGSSDYAKRAYEERVRHKQWEQERKNEEIKLLNFIKSFSKKY